MNGHAVESCSRFATNTTKLLRYAGSVIELSSVLFNEPQRLCGARNSVAVRVVSRHGHSKWHLHSPLVENSVKYGNSRQRQAELIFFWKLVTLPCQIDINIIHIWTATSIIQIIDINDYFLTVFWPCYHMFNYYCRQLNWNVTISNY